VLFTAAAFVVPLTTRRALYCQYLCPHGALQDWADKVVPRRYRPKIRPEVAAGLRWGPYLTLLMALGVTMLALPMDLAGIEPFDAYLVRSAGAATIVVAVVGLVAALFIPMAYCKFGCPTGALLEFVRSHGAADRFGRRDIAALVLVTWTAGFYVFHNPLWEWIRGM
jgi:polyferredoxin